MSGLFLCVSHNSYLYSMNKMKSILLKLWYKITDLLPWVKRRRENKVVGQIQEERLDNEQRLLAMIGASFLKEFEKNRSLRQVVKKKSPVLKSRLKALGINVDR